jgi:hypothetical protein
LFVCFFSSLKYEIERERRKKKEKEIIILAVHHQGRRMKRQSNKIAIYICIYKMRENEQKKTKNNQSKLYQYILYKYI